MNDRIRRRSIPVVHTIVPGYKTKNAFVVTCSLIAVLAAGCQEPIGGPVFDLHNPPPVLSKFLNVPLIQQGAFECGPASLAMCSCYLANTKCIGRYRTSSEVRDDLVRINPQYFWIAYDLYQNPKPIYPTGDELPVVVLPGGSEVPFTLTEGYVIKGIDMLSGTYPGYMKEVALSYYSATSASVSTFEGGTSNLIRNYLNEDIPVIVDVWAHGYMELGFLEGASYTHFVVVVGYKEGSFTINDPYTNSRMDVDVVTFENAWSADGLSGVTQPHAPGYRRGWGMVILPPGSTCFPLP
jgi:hypothetical protein